jgi:hypothetical protein
VARSDDQIRFEGDQQLALVQHSDLSKILHACIPLQQRSIHKQLEEINQLLPASSHYC